MIAVPRYGIALAPGHTAEFEATLSRDWYDRPELKGEEVTFGQLVARYEQTLDGGNQWGTGLGVNALRQDGSDASRWHRVRERDRFWTARYRIALEGHDWTELTLQLKEQALDYTFDAPDYDESGRLVNVGGRYQVAMGAVRGDFQLLLADLNAEGRYARKNSALLSAHLARYVGTAVADLGASVLRDRFDETLAGPAPVQPVQTLRTLTLDVTWPIVESLFVAGQLRGDALTSNVPDADYDSRAVSLSMIHVY